MKSTHVGRRTVVVGLALTALVAALAVQPAIAAGPVTAVTGSAYGYRAYSIGFFGGSSLDTGPTPQTVPLNSNANNSPQQASAISGLVHYPPAVLFSSDAITVSTAGALGAHGFATSSATINNINTSATQPLLTGSEILTASSIASNCSASTDAGTSGATTVTSGVLQTDSGWDNGDGDYLDPGEHLPSVAPISPAPAAGTKMAGHLHPFAGQTDYFVLVFNEQSTSNGVLTVNAVHEYFGHKLDSNGNIVEDAAYSAGGSVLHGHLVLGRSVCGVTTAGG